MKKALLIGSLLLIACGYLGVAGTQAGETWGVIWGYVTYPPPWQNIFWDDYAHVLNNDYSPTPFWDWICGAYPHKYWITNDLESDLYRLKVWAADCELVIFCGPFYYEEGTMYQYDVTACQHCFADR